MKFSRGGGRRQGLRSLAGWLAVAAIVLASVTAALLTERNNRRDSESRQDAEAHRVAVAVDTISSLSIAQLRAAAAFVENHSNLRSAQFNRFMETILSDQPMRSLAYLEVVPAQKSPNLPIRDKRLGYSVRILSTPSTAIRLVPADRTETKRMVDALHRVRASGLPGITAPTQLKGSDEPYLIIFHPVSAGGSDASGRRPGAKAFTAGTIAVKDLLEATSALLPAGTQVALVGPEGAVLSSDPPLGSDYASTAIVIADRTWELRLSIPRDDSRTLPLLLAVAGLTLAALIGFLLLNWSRRERHALELARVRLQERDRALRLEAETNRMYRVLAENLTDIVIVADPDTRITYVSPAAERMLGWFPEEMVGRYVLEFMHEEDRSESGNRLAKLRSGAGILTFEHRLRRRDGTYLWAESAVRSIFDRDGERIVEYQSTTRDISERKPLQEQLERLAREDPLTGLVNRRQFGEVMAIEVARVQRYGGESCLLLIDVDFFKHVNDAHGHLAGDRVLRQVADLMRTRMRGSDTLSRMGGDEFAAILPDTDADEGEMVAAALMAEVRHTFEADPDLPAITVSVGIAGFGAEEGLTPERVVERADLALYTAKAEGRDRLSVYDTVEASAQVRQPEHDPGT